MSVLFTIYNCKYLTETVLTLTTPYMSTTIKFYNKNKTTKILKFSLSLIADGKAGLKAGSA